MTPEHRKLIDRALLTVAHELGLRLRDVTPRLQSAATALSLEELRASPLGRNLALLAHVVDGEPTVPRSRVAAAIAFVQTALFVPLGAPDPGTDVVGIPLALLETPVGQLLNAARVRTLDVSTAVLLGEAGRRLGLTKSTMYRLIDRGEIAVIDVGGRKMISGEEYQRLAARAERERRDQAPAGADGAAPSTANGAQAGAGVAEEHDVFG